MAPGGAAAILARAKAAFGGKDYDGAEKLCKDALAIVDKGGTGADVKMMRAEIFTMLADIKNLNGLWVDSIFYQDSVTRIWFELGNNKMGIESLVKTGMALTRKGKQAEAMTAFQKAQQMAAKHGNRLLGGRALFGMGSVYWRQAMFDEALKNAEQAAAVGKKEGDQELSGLAFGLIAVIRSDQGHYKESIASYKQAIEALEKTDNHYDLARNLSNLGETHMTVKDYHEATRVLERARKIAEEHQNKRSLGHIMNNLATCHLRSGDVEGARQRAEQAGSILEGVEDRYARGNLHLVWAQIYTATKDYAKADANYEKATHTMMELRIPYDTGMSLLEHGRALGEQEKLEDAIRMTRLSAAAFEEAGADAMSGIARGELDALRARRSRAKKR